VRQLGFVRRLALLAASLSVGCGLVGGIDGDAYELAGGSGSGGGGTQHIELFIEQTDQDATDDHLQGSLANCVIGDATYGDAAGLQWPLEVPRGATILEAHFTVRSNGAVGITDPFVAGIHVEEVDDAQPFDGAANDIHGREYWSMGVVSWPIPLFGLEENLFHQAPDVTDLVQHIVDRDGWQKGNRVGFGVFADPDEDTGGTQTRLYDFEDDTDSAAHLTVKWAAP
jgi:hypothetical protein